MQDNSISRTHTVSANFFSMYVCLFLQAYKWLQQVTELTPMAAGACPQYQWPPAIHHHLPLRQHKRAETAQKVSERLYSTEPQLGEYSLKVESALLK